MRVMMAKIMYNGTRFASGKHMNNRLDCSYIAGIPPLAHGLSLKLSTPHTCSFSSPSTAGQIAALSGCVEEVCLHV